MISLGKYPLFLFRIVTVIFHLRTHKCIFLILRCVIYYTMSIIIVVLHFILLVMCENLKGLFGILLRLALSEKE